MYKKCADITFFIHKILNMLSKQMGTKTTGQISSEFITKLQRSGKSVFSISEAMKISEKNDPL